MSVGEGGRGGEEEEASGRWLLEEEEEEETETMTWRPCVCVCVCLVGAHEWSPGRVERHGIDPKSELPL